MTQQRRKNEIFAIRCDSEGGTILSSKLESEAWEANQALVEYLENKKISQVGEALFSWKRIEGNHLANAKETYAWREVIDDIKTAELEEVVRSLRKEPGKESSALLKSKPIMLRVAGEVTNSLLHSYNNRHRITYFQCDSTEPSSDPT